MQKLSVVVANYNYERFVGTAISSALDIRWPEVEVVVVDDGSTDDSLTVIRGFGERVQVLCTENASQRVAANRGYALTTGDVVIFLDADDVLPRDVAVQLDASWGPRVSKAQFRMQRIDVDGSPVGRPFPAYDPVPTPAQIRSWAELTSAHPCPPGSGNAYARWFLEQVMPIGDDVGDAADSALLAAAPFFGDVVSLPDVVVGYRRHEGNDSNLMADDRRFPREVDRARSRWLFARMACGDALADERPLFRSRELLQLRVSSRRLVPAAHPLAGDGLTRMLYDVLRSPFAPGPESWRLRLAVVAWCLAVLVSPPRLARRLVRVRYGRHK